MSRPCPASGAGGGAGDRVRVVAGPGAGGVAPHLTPPLLGPALEAARAIGDAGWRSEALAAWRPAWRDRAPDRGPGGGAGDRGRGAAGRALAALVPHLTPPERDQALREALEAARAIGTRGRGPSAGGAGAPPAPTERARSARALEAARAVGDEWSGPWRWRRCAPPDAPLCSQRRWRWRGRSGTRGGGPRRWRRWRPACADRAGPGTAPGAGGGAGDRGRGAAVPSAGGAGAPPGGTGLPGRGPGGGAGDR